MANIVTTSVGLTNGKMMFEANARDNPTIISDYTPPVGDGKGYMSLELFLISLSTCLGGALSVLLRKTGKTIEALDIAAKGVRREQHPTSFEHITLTIRIKAPQITEAEVNKALALSEASICPVWAMIKGNVEVETQITLEA